MPSVNRLILLLAFAQTVSGPSVVDLLDHLANPAERAQAANDLIQRGQTSESDKNEIAGALAEKIKHLENRDLWRAEVKLAGDLKLTSLAPLIAQSLDLDTRCFPGGIHSFTKDRVPTTIPP